MRSPKLSPHHSLEPWSLRQRCTLLWQQEPRELPLRYVLGVQDLQQQPALGSTNQGAQTNETQSKQPNCPSEPFLCSNESCGGHVSCLNQWCLVLHIIKSKLTKGRTANSSARLQIRSSVAASAALIDFLDAPISNVVPLRQFGMELGTSHLWGVNLNLSLGVNVNYHMFSLLRAILIIMKATTLNIIVSMDLEVLSRVLGEIQDWAKQSRSASGYSPTLLLPKLVYIPRANIKTKEYFVE